MEDENNIIDELIVCLNQEIENRFNIIKEDKNKNRFLKLKRINFNNKELSIEINSFVNEVLEGLETYRQTFEENEINCSPIIIERLQELIETDKNNNK